ncbi:MAG: hypothetical protein EOO88_57070, partial [Pedobacter sp.]
MNGADNVTINGDNPNSAGINRNLTITNTASNTITYTMAVRIAVATSIVTSANGNAIINCVINGSATGRSASANTSTTASENTTYGIYAGGGASTVSATTAPTAIASLTTTAGTGATMTNLIISNNTITSAARAIMVQGAAATVATGLSIVNNIIGNSVTGQATTVYSYGIGASGGSGSITGNNIRNIESYLATSIRAISIGDIASVTNDAFIVDKNIISNVINRNTGGYSAYGINVAAGTGNIIQNNFIYGLNCVYANTIYGSTFGLRGIRVVGGTSHKILHNSVNMSGPPLSGTVDVSACLTVTATSITGLDIRNNIFSNTMVATSATSTCMQLISGGTTAMAFT